MGPFVQGNRRLLKRRSSETEPVDRPAPPSIHGQPSGCIDEPHGREDSLEPDEPQLTAVEDVGCLFGAKVADLPQGPGADVTDVFSSGKEVFSSEPEVEVAEGLPKAASDTTKLVVMPH